jgi:RNA polymerase subunit RPABC4/transcription elongation factor Spt4
MRCPKCRKTIEPDTKICPSCKRVIVAGVSNDSPYADILKPRSRVSTKGLGSRMSGTSHVTATRHKISTSDKSDSSQKIRCMKCNTVNEKSDRFCRNCRTRITS